VIAILDGGARRTGQLKRNGGGNANRHLPYVLSPAHFGFGGQKLMQSLFLYDHACGHLACILAGHFVAFFMERRLPRSGIADDCGALRSSCSVSGNEPAAALSAFFLTARRSRLAPCFHLQRRAETAGVLDALAKSRSCKVADPGRHLASLAFLGRDGVYLVSPFVNTRSGAVCHPAAYWSLSWPGAPQRLRKKKVLISLSYVRSSVRNCTAESGTSMQLLLWSAGGGADAGMEAFSFRDHAGMAGHVRNGPSAVKWPGLGWLYLPPHRGMGRGTTGNRSRYPDRCDCPGGSLR